MHNQSVCVSRLKLVLTVPEAQIHLISTLSELIHFNIFLKTIKGNNLETLKHIAQITFIFAHTYARKLALNEVFLTFLVFDSKVDADQLRHFVPHFCFALSIWKWLKIPRVNENDPSTPVQSPAPSQPKHSRLQTAALPTRAIAVSQPPWPRRTWLFG